MRFVFHPTERIQALTRLNVLRSQSAIILVAAPGLAGTEVNRAEIRLREPDFTAGAKVALYGEGNLWVADLVRWQSEWAKSRPKIAAIGA